MIKANLILKTGETYQLKPEEISVYQRSYPHLDLEKQFRIMEAWCMSNPSKRKTKHGILRFVNNWLSNQKPDNKSLADMQSTSYVKDTTRTTNNAAPFISQLRRSRSRISQGAES